LDIESGEIVGETAAEQTEKILNNITGLLSDLKSSQRKTLSDAHP
jgi:enamine deaminase RidA (YjgF/YER057c/UK114 family)